MLILPERLLCQRLILLANYFSYNRMMLISDDPFGYLGFIFQNIFKMKSNYVYDEQHPVKQRGTVIGRNGEKDEAGLEAGFGETSVLHVDQARPGFPLPRGCRQVR
jgi:hypothetical protein